MAAAVGVLLGVGIFVAVLVYLATRKNAGRSATDSSAMTPAGGSEAYAYSSGSKDCNSSADSGGDCGSDGGGGDGGGGD